MTPDQRSRLDRLSHRCIVGPDYLRGVADDVGDFYHFDQQGNDRFAEAALLSAELRAGLLGQDEYAQRYAAALERKE